MPFYLSNKLILIVASFALALVTIPLARQMLPNDNQFYVYLLFKIWMFGVVPTLFVWLEYGRKNEEETDDIK